MKAIQIKALGGPEVMVLEEVARPEAGPGQLLVKIEAIGLNYIDTYQRSGLYKMNLPFIPGNEAAGVIEAVGPGVSGFKVGESVTWTNILGSYAEYQAINAERAVPLPKGLNAKLAAAVMLQGMTAHYLCKDTFPLKKGDVCLIHAGAGGVGLLLIQMCKMIGATVLTTVSTEEKAALAKGAGADHVILYTQVDFEEEVKRIMGNRKLDVVYDSVAKTTFDKGLNLLRPRGMMVLYGASSGPVPPFDPQSLNPKGSLFLTRPSLGHYVATREDLVKRAGEVLGWVQKGKLNVRIGAEFPLAKAAESHRALEGRKTTGKVVLIP
ncbi:MAG: quinone oxidoreductase [Deltaproteobacteria bacterium]|nr:quinone oxidoreductase [Deltaproteobacteria bacterium]